MTRRTWIGAVAVATLAATGCGAGKLKKELSFNLDAAPSQAWGFDPQSADQTFKAEVSSNHPVDVFILTGVDENAATGMDNDELEKKAVGVKRDTTADTVTGKIPAKQSAVVVVRFGSKRQPATGKIKLSN
jgi:hypothetical protein